MWLYEPKSKRGSKKLIKPWTGPYVILKKINDVIFKIQKNPKSNAKIVHHDRLMKYLGGGNSKLD